MLNVNETVKSLLLENYRQIIRIRFPNGEDTIELTERDLVQGTFRWDRYCATGDMLEIGTATSAEIEFTVRNTDGRLKTDAGQSVPIEDISFEGKELSVEIGISKWDARRWENATVHWFPIGKFTVMSMPHKFSTIPITALDRMTWFDMYVPTDSDNPFAAAETLSSIVSKICGATNMLYVLPATLPNLDLVVDMDALFEDEPQTTYRMLIQWVAELTGTCAYIDTEGRLVFRWLERAEDVQITSHHRYPPSVVYEPVAFTGLDVEKDDVIAEIGSSSLYRFHIVNNALIQGDDWLDRYRRAFTDIWAALRQTAEPYRPFDATVLPMPYLEPLDIISYVDSNGETFDTLITHITYTLNGSTSLSAVGISETEAQCVTPSGRTSREQADIKALKNKIAYLENAAAAARDRLSGLFRMALGLHMIEVTAEAGGSVYYFTTASVPDTGATLSDLEGTLQPNDVIYTFSEAGWAWCFGDDWDFASQTPKTDTGWRYGIAKDGSAVLGLINTEGINVSDEDTTYRTEITPERFSVYNGTNLVFGFNGQLESQINRLLVKSNIDDPTLENDAYIRLGSAMLIPASGGLDIVYVEDI